MKRHSLRTIFVLSAILVILVTSGTAGYISHVNATGAVREVSRSLHREVSTRIVDHLHGFLSLPHLILEQNARLIASGSLPSTDQGALQAFFLSQAAVPTEMTSLYFGNTEGGLAGAGHEGRRVSFYTTGTQGFVAGPFTKTAVDPAGNSRGELVALPGYDARERPWYRAALARDGGAWGDIYLLFTGHDLALAPSRAVRDADGRLLGVVGADIFVSHVGRFLTDLHVDVPGLTYIMDRAGLLVASSSGEAPFRVDARDRPTDRLAAADSARPLVAESARLILSGALPTSDVARVPLAGQRYAIDVTPFEDARGLSWLITTVVPVAPYEAPLAAANLRTVMLITLAVALMAGLAAILIRRVLAPLAEVAASAEAVGRGDLTRTLPEGRRNEIGAVARAFNGMVTRLHDAQAQQARRIADLREAEARFRNLFNSVEVAICTQDFTDMMAHLGRLRADGVRDLRAHLRAHPGLIWDLAAQVRVVACNAATRRLFGFMPGEADTPSLDTCFTAETIDVFADEVCAIWAGESQFRGEMSVRTVDGQDRIILFSLPIPDTPEDGRGVPVSLVDLTDRKRAEEALRRKNAALLRSNAELESFAHVAAHDLREPLRTMASYATLLRRRVTDRLTAEERDFLGYLHEGALRMDALISDLLDFARVGRNPKPLVPVPLAEVVEDAVADLRANIDLSGAVLDVAADLPMVRGDAEELVRVFTNLIGNAVKYRRPDQPLRVEIGADPGPQATGEAAGSPARWEVFVRDNGIGLAPGHGYEDRIFGLFQRLHARDAHGGGTGIGLSICKKVVEHHGGSIWAESPGENQGCTIRFTLLAA
ncbi:ATP-binding protein [Roseospira visakhapatnamensis]|uniref:histidine kinase n=1 Tax=Roseospira visakhapatnamensis TaxID=390880 RepID=A0A7W6W9X0_9PROT|nr:ATP-binding protein [Roseospira visakhapatnamensis]MBB4266253.1 signal transduction histidine kinase [Roseospira visakhapatnamensis]